MQYPKCPKCDSNKCKLIGTQGRNSYRALLQCRDCSDFFYMDSAALPEPQCLAVWHLYRIAGMNGQTIKSALTWQNVETLGSEIAKLDEYFQYGRFDYRNDSFVEALAQLIYRLWQTRRDGVKADEVFDKWLRDGDLPKRKGIN